MISFNPVPFRQEVRVSLLRGKYGLGLGHGDAHTHANDKSHRAGPTLYPGDVSSEAGDVVVIPAPSAPAASGSSQPGPSAAGPSAPGPSTPAKSKKRRTRQNVGSDAEDIDLQTQSEGSGQEFDLDSQDDPADFDSPAGKRRLRDMFPDGDDSP